MLGLTQCLATRPPMLSAGQRQRVALGRALVRRASVLLLDEPLANVDPTLWAQMRDEIADLRRELGTTMIYVTHDHLEAMMVGDRVAVLREGELQQVGQPQALYARPANLFVAGFLGYPPMNLFPGALASSGTGLFFRLSAGSATTKGGSEPVPQRQLRLDSSASLEPYSSLVMGLRPEHITCGPGQPREAPEAVIQAKLLGMQVLGPDTYLRATVAGNGFVARVARPEGWTPGQEYPFRLDLRQAVFFDPATGKLIAP